MTLTAADAVRNAHAWFEVNSGWAPPDEDTLAEWIADGVCRCPDECLVAPDAWCEHGLASWHLILAAEERETAGLRGATRGRRRADNGERRLTRGAGTLPLVIEAATATLQEQLDGAADEATRQWWEAYLKGTARFRGVPMAGIRAAVRRTWREHDLAGATTADLLTLAHRWFREPATEDKLAAVLLLVEHLAGRLTVGHVEALAAPFAAGHISDWGVCDWYATKALHGFLTSDPADMEPRARALATWGTAANLWQRRAALVAFVKLAPRAQEQFRGFTPLVLQLCRDNLVVDDRFAHTGPGWVLRELSRAEPDQVRQFVAENPGLSPEGTRMALARLRSGPYRRR